jgi:uncharacterized membrane protein YfcA
MPVKKKGVIMKKVSKSSASSKTSPSKNVVERKGKPVLGPVGIGGWLILFIVMLSLDVINSLVELTFFYDEISALSVLNHFIIIVFSIFLLILFYKNSRYTPKIFIFYVWLIYIVQLIAALVYRSKSAVTYIGLISMLVITVAVTLYFKNSVRAKNTFVR